MAWASVFSQTGALHKWIEGCAPMFKMQPRARHLLYSFHRLSKINFGFNSLSKAPLMREWQRFLIWRSPYPVNPLSQPMKYLSSGILLTGISYSSFLPGLWLTNCLEDAELILKHFIDILIGHLYSQHLILKSDWNYRLKPGFKSLFRNVLLNKVQAIFPNRIVIHRH